MDSRLKKRLTHTATHHPCTSQNAYGDRTFGTPIDRNCFRDGRVTMVKNIEGEEVVSSITLYFDGLFPISVKDHFVFEGKEYPVINYQPYDGLEMNHGTTAVYI